jgi:hypothetical protein
MTMRLRTKIVFLACSALLVGALRESQVPAIAQTTGCTQTLSTGANLASAVSGSASGATICL